MEEYLCLFDISKRLNAYTAAAAQKALSARDANIVTTNCPNDMINLSCTNSFDQFMSGADESSLRENSSGTNAVQTILYDNNSNSDDVELASFKRLPGELMRAITSTKLSKSENYALLGYGVRSKQREVVDHPNK